MSGPRFARDASALSADDLAELRGRLAKMPDDKLRRWYGDCLHMCRLDHRGNPPKAAFPQQLVQGLEGTRAPPQTGRVGLTKCAQIVAGGECSARESFASREAFIGEDPPGARR